MLAREAAEIVPDLRDSIGKWESDTQNVDLNEVVRNAVSVISEAGNGEKIAIEMSLALEPQLLKGNVIQLQQIVLNLLQNALESIHGVGGEGVVTIRTFTNNDQEIELTVSDNGTGLQPEVATRMFDALITTKQNRLGMGLPIALTIIEAYRGRLWVDPNPEGGTTFHVTFPTGNRR
jgi:two-component system sensor kinase FixL